MEIFMNAVVVEIVMKALGGIVLGGINYTSFLHNDLKNSTDEHTQAVNYFEQGLKSYNSKDYIRAVDFFNESIAREAGNLEVYVDRGNALLQRNECAGAEDSYTGAIRLSPSDSNLYVNRGNSYVCSNMMQEAISDYDKALDLNPNNIIARQDKEILERYLRGEPIKNIVISKSIEKKDDNIISPQVPGLQTGLDCAKYDRDIALFLNKYIMNNDVMAVKCAIGQGADIESKDFLDRTPLMLASYFGNIEIVKLLLEQGVELNARNKDNNTALILAGYFGNTDIVELLLDKGARTDFRNKNGNTALIEAAQSDKIDIVEKLILKGADMNMTNNQGNTALIEASIKGNTQIVKLLIQNGADKKIQNYEKQTACDVSNLNVIDKVTILGVCF